MASRSYGWAVVGLASGAILSVGLSLLIALHPLAEAGGFFGVPFGVCADLLADARMRAALGISTVVLFVGPPSMLALLTWLNTTARTNCLGTALEALAETSGGVSSIAGHKVTIVPSPQPFAFTLGFSVPKLFISSAAAETLTEAEIEAVVLHEAHHAEHRDPLKKQMMLCLRSALSLIPGARAIIDRYLVAQEFDADDAAVRATGRQLPLVTAFAKLAQGPADAATSNFRDHDEERISRLLGRPIARSRLPLALWAGQATTAFALLPLATLMVTEWHLIHPALGF